MSIQTVAVLGAGIMGRGIAYVAALGGYTTLLQDTNREQLEKGLNDLGAVLEKGVAMGKVAEADALSARKRVRGVTSLEEAAQHADLIIEAVPEQIELKIEIFAQLAEDGHVASLRRGELHGEVVRLELVEVLDDRAVATAVADLAARAADAHAHTGGWCFLKGHWKASAVLICNKCC